MLPGRALRLLALVLTLLLGAGSACDRAPDRPPEPPAAPAPAIDEDLADQLAALGYAESSDDFADPERSGAVVLDAAAVAPGYSLYTAPFACEARLIDLEGAVVHRWRDDPGDDARQGECVKWGQADLLPDGGLLVPVNARPPAGRRTGTHLLRLDWDGAVVWAVPMRAHHDAEQAPDGTVRALSKRNRRDHPFPESDAIIDNTVVVLSADGEIQREISLYDVLRENDLGFELVSRPPFSQGGPIDLLHANSVETLPDLGLADRHPLYAPGNLLVSVRHQDLAMIFDPGTGDGPGKLLWAFGRGELEHPHDARMLDDGHVLVFDNGVARKWSRVVEIDPLTSRIVWSYGDPVDRFFYSEGRGSAQKLPNGNLLVANSNEGEAFEVTHEGDLVWRFYHPDLDEAGHRQVIVRMVRYPPERIEPLLAREP